MVFSLPPSAQNLIITGYDEPNKPRLVRQVAERLNLRFVDVPTEIETRTGDTVDTLRDTYGLRHLRAVEDDVLADISLYRSTVIRMNGSTLANSERLPEIQRTGQIVVLVARLDAILQRMHLTMGARYHDPDDRSAAVGALQREWAVRKLPNIIEIDTTYKDEAAIIDKLVAIWRDIGIERG